MTVDIKIAGSNVTPAERQYWASEISITEDASPVSLSDSFSGVGALSVKTTTLDNTMLSQGATLDVTLTQGGTRSGIITGLSDADGTVTVTADTTMAKLNRIISAPVIKTNLGDALTSYFSLCGIGVGDYTIDPTLAARAILLPGWKDNAWTKIKQLSAVEMFDMNEVGSAIQVAPRTSSRTLDVSNAAGTTRTIAGSPAGLNVETHMYVYSQITNHLVYPPAAFDNTYGTTSKAGFRLNSEVIQVTPGTPVVKDIPLMASLTSVQQPVCVKTVGPNDNSASVYTVMMKDGIETIDPAEWTARGGYIKAEILPDTTTMRITVDAGNNLFAAAPFRICMSDGQVDYSTLRIVATGLAIDKTRLRMRTGTPDWMTSQDVATSTDSIFVRNQDQARRMLRAQAGEASLSASGITVQMGPMDTTIGLRAGAYIQRGEANYRVRTSVLSGDTSTITADRSTKIADLNAVWAGKKVADFNAAWVGYKVRNVNSAPLLVETPAAPTLPSRTGYGVGGYGEGGYGG